MEDYRKMAEANQRRGREIIAETQLVESWEAIGAQANLIGSLSTGLMMKKLDIDMHVYTDTLSIKESFRAAARIASHPGIVRMEYTNLIDTEEECIEWHAAYRDRDGRMWKMDMIHIRRGSAYDGFAERMASRIGAVLTEETRDAILRLKYETPDTESVIGAEYYAAVLSGGVRDYAGLTAWREAHRGDSLIGWLPPPAAPPRRRASPHIRSGSIRTRQAALSFSLTIPYSDSNAATRLAISVSTACRRNLLTIPRKSVSLRRPAPPETPSPSIPQPATRPIYPIRYGTAPDRHASGRAYHYDRPTVTDGHTPTSVSGILHPTAKSLRAATHCRTTNAPRRMTMTGKRRTSPQKATNLHRAPRHRRRNKNGKFKDSGRIRLRRKKESAGYRSRSPM